MKLNEIKLNEHEMIDLLAGVRGVYALAGVDHYSCMSQAPSFKVCPIRLYISKALDLDLTEDIAKNRKINAMTNEYKESIKNYNEQISNIEGYKTLWTNDLVGSLEQIVCNFLRNDTPINQVTKDRLDTLLQKYYNGVMDIISVSQEKYEETEFSVMTDKGYEKLYRRVK